MCQRLLDRTVTARHGRAKLTNREFIYRSAFELGRHVIGYEVEKVLALVEERSLVRTVGQKQRIGVFGHGEGGAIALYAAALDPRIDFGLRQRLFRQPRRCLAAASRPQCFRPARAIWRCRNRLTVAPRIADGGSGPGSGIRDPARDWRRAGTLDDPKARYRPGRGRAGPKPGCRAETAALVSISSQAVLTERDRSAPIEALQKLVTALTGTKPARASSCRAQTPKPAPTGTTAPSTHGRRLARPANFMSSTAKISGCWSRAPRCGGST